MNRELHEKKPFGSSLTSIPQLVLRITHIEGCPSASWAPHQLRLNAPLPSILGTLSAYLISPEKTLTYEFLYFRKLLFTTDGQQLFCIFLASPPLLIHQRHRKIKRDDSPPPSKKHDLSSMFQLQSLKSTPLLKKDGRTNRIGLSPQRCPQIPITRQNMYKFLKSSQQTPF